MTLTLEANRLRNQRRRQNPTYREQQAAINKAWHERNAADPARLERKAEQMRGYAQQHKTRHAARRALRTAIESGRVSPEPCAVCGAARVEGHHVAYDMPLCVVWLCRPHHQQLHAEAKATGAAA